MNEPQKPRLLAVGTAVVISSPNGEVQGVFLLPATAVSEKDKAALYDEAEKYNQSVEFVEVNGWNDLAAIKRGIQELNGEG